MNILHITGHLGGGLGTVICDWMKKQTDHKHVIASLDSINPKAATSLYESGVPHMQGLPWKGYLKRLIEEADVVLLHYWPHPMIKSLLSLPFPPCRLVIWSHHNSVYPPAELSFPDLWLDTSPIQGHGRHIWSTGDISRFLEIKPKAHTGFNIGYVGTVDWKKMHPEWLTMCIRIKQAIPEARFTVVGENKTGINATNINFVGKVDDVAPCLAEFDVFGYPLRQGHYGTAEQALGEAMAAGVVPVVMDNQCERTICGEATARTVAEYVRMVEMLYQAPEMRRSLSDDVRNHARQLYSLDRMISQWNKVFEDIMMLPKKTRTPL